MSTDDIKTIIDNVAEDTFKVIKQVYEYQKESKPKESRIWSKVGSRIIFPKYSENNKTKKRKIRISEQELRFIFVEQFNKSKPAKKSGLFYSIETPTENFYNFNGAPRVVKKDEHDKNKGEKGAGRSANIDLVIYQKKDDNINRVALIEFKAHNPDENDYRKDICKLINEESENNCSKYFIHIINVRNQEGTLKNILDDKIINIDALKEEGKNINYCINYICFNLYNKTGHKFTKGKIKNNKLEDIEECESLSTEEKTR